MSRPASPSGPLIGVVALALAGALGCAAEGPESVHAGTDPAERQHRRTPASLAGNGPGPADQRPAPGPPTDAAAAPSVTRDAGAPLPVAPGAAINSFDAGMTAATLDAAAAPSPTPVPAPAPRADAAAATPPDAAPLRIVRAQDVLVDRVRAGIIYAEKIEVQEARIGRTVTSPEERRWETGSSRKIEGDELDADVLYAKLVKGKSVEAGEVFAKEVKTGK